MLVAAVAPMLSATAASAAPKPGPSAVVITGEGLAEPLHVRAEADALLFAAVLDQVSYLTGTGETSSPSAVDLGPKFTLVVLVGTTETSTYDLYPLAKGGPRAFRPAQQPGDRSTTAAWFFGRLTMSEALRAAGAPLPERDDPLAGGIGGGGRIIPQDTLNPGDDLDRLLADLRHVLLVNAGVVVLITIALAGISLLVRRRTR